VHLKKSKFTKNSSINVLNIVCILLIQKLKIKMNLIP